MMYSAFVKDKETGEKRFIESDYPTRSNFLNDLKANGYTVYRAEPKEVYDYILRNTNGSKTDWEIAKKLYKENKPLTKEEFEKMKDNDDKLDHEVVNDFAIDAIKDNFTPPGAKGEIEKDDNIGKRFKTKLGKSYSIKKEIDPDTYGIHWEDDNSPRGEAILDRMEKNLHNDSLRTGYISELKDDIDTNDNGEIEVDEMADFQKSLDDYASKNKKGRDDIPVTTRR